MLHFEQLNMNKFVNDVSELIQKGEELLRKITTSGFPNNIHGLMLFSCYNKKVLRWLLNGKMLWKDKLFPFLAEADYFSGLFLLLFLETVM